MSKNVRIGMIAAVVLGWILFYGKIFMDGRFAYDFFLPFELCNMMQFVIIYAAVTNKPRTLDYIMYLAILGPISAFVYPFGIATFGPFYFVYFLFYHLVLMAVGVYRWVQRKGYVEARDFFGAVGFLVISAGIASIANYFTGGNYMFVAKAIFPTPFHYQIFLSLLAIIILVAFHKILVNSRKIWSRVQEGRKQNQKATEKTRYRA